MKYQNPKEARSSVSARRVLGATAHDPDGRPVGTINDLIIEPQHGQVAFIIIHHRDVAGHTQRFAIPPDGYELTDDSAVIRVDPATFQRSPGRW